MFRRDSDNRVRLAAVTALQELIKVEDGSGGHFQLGTLIDTFLTEYNCGKCSVGLKSGILELLGIFFRYFPESVLHRASAVQGLYLDTLDTVSC